MSNQISNLHPYWFRALANEYDARARSVAEFIAGQRLALATAKGPDDRIQRLEYGVMSNLEFDHRIKLSIAVCKRRRAPRQTPQDRRLQKQEGRDRAVQGTGRNDARTAQGNDAEPQFAYPVASLNRRGPRGCDRRSRHRPHGNEARGAFQLHPIQRRVREESRHLARWKSPHRGSSLAATVIMCAAPGSDPKSRNDAFLAENGSSLCFVLTPIKTASTSRRKRLRRQQSRLRHSRRLNPVQSPRSGCGITNDDPAPTIRKPARKCRRVPEDRVADMSPRFQI